MIYTMHKYMKENKLPSWDNSFFCSSRISDWDIPWSLVWFSLWILWVSPVLSGPGSPCPDTSLGPEAAIGD